MPSWRVKYIQPAGRGQHQCQQWRPPYSEGAAEAPLALVCKSPKATCMTFVPLHVSGGAILHADKDHHLPMERGRCHSYQACSSHANHGELNQPAQMLSIVPFIHAADSFQLCPDRECFLSETESPVLSRSSISALSRQPLHIMAQSLF